MSLATIRRNLGALAGMAVTALLLTLILSQYDGWHVLERADSSVVLLALAVALFLDTFCGAVKWWLVVNATGVRAGFFEIWKIWLGLLPATFFAPFQSGHLLYAVALRNAKRIGGVHALECVAYDKWINVVATVGLVVLGQLVLPADNPFRHTLILLGGVAVLVFYLFDHTAIRMLGRSHYYRERSHLLHSPIELRCKIGLLLMALVYQSSDVLSAFLACRAFGLSISAELIFGLFPVVLLLSYAPISFSGFGVREDLAVLLFASALTYDQAVSVGFAVDFLEYVAPAVVGIVALPAVLRILGSWKQSDSTLLDDPKEESNDCGDPTPP